MSVSPFRLSIAPCAQARVGKLVGAHVDLDVPEREIVRQGSGRHRQSQPREIALGVREVFLGRAGRDGDGGGAQRSGRKRHLDCRGSRRFRSRIADAAPVFMLGLNCVGHKRA